VRIEVDDLSGPKIAEFLAEHLAEMASITPLESKHALPLEELRAPEVTFWSAWDDDRLVGCAALKRLDPTHAEVKSMRTARDRRRGGVGSRLLAHLIEEARRRGFRRLSLETGSDDFFASARALYAKFGFTECEPFADYRPDPLSVFLTREL